jgi:hypothetical protein
MKLISINRFVETNKVICFTANLEDKTVDFYAFPSYGCYVHANMKSIITIPITTDNEIHLEEWSEVSDPVDNMFLMAVNNRFGTRFKMENFG